MKGSSRTVRICDISSKTNFNDWSDPKPPLKREKKSVAYESSTQPEYNYQSLKPVLSQTTLEIIEIKNKIKQGLPLLSKKEIRNFRLPFHESLLQNLKEDGFLLTYEFIKDLIAIDDIFHKAVETNFNLKNRPILKLSQSVLIPLKDGLMKAETSKLSGEKNKEATAFLDLAILFGNAKDMSWHWVAQEMFEQCMDVVDGNSIDLQLKATAKYYYARFLFSELHKLTEAKTQIEFAISISETKYWTIGDKDGKKGNTLHFESCILLHEIFLGMAQNEMIGQNSEEAIMLCRNALQLAKMIDSKVSEANALKDLINIYLSVQQLYSIPDLLQSYMKLCTDLKDYEGLCEGYILYARYHDSLEEQANVIEDMKKLLRTAEENQIKKMVAVAHHKLAIYCLLRGTGKELLKHAIEAYMCHMDLKKSRKDIEETRCLVGIAQAQKIMTDYCGLVSEADNYDSIDLLILIRWKNLRVPFFDQKMEFIPELARNRELLDKLENSRIEELLINVKNRQVELISSVSTSISKHTSIANQASMSSFSSRGARWALNTGVQFSAAGSDEIFKHGINPLSNTPSLQKSNHSVKIATFRRSGEDDDGNKSVIVSFVQ